MKLFGWIKQKKLVLTLAVLAVLVVPSLVSGGVVHAIPATDTTCTISAYTDKLCSVDLFYATAVQQCIPADNLTWSLSSQSCSAYKTCSAQNASYKYGNAGNVCPGLWTARAKYIAAGATAPGGGGVAITCPAGTAWDLASGTCKSTAPPNGCTGSENSGGCVTTGPGAGNGSCGGSENSGGACTTAGDNPVAAPTTPPATTSDGSQTCSAANTVKCDATSCPLAAGVWDAAKKVCTFVADPAATSGRCASAERCDLIQNYINPFIQFLSALVGVGVTISIVIGGIQYASSAGDPQQAGAAKTRIRNSLIALLAFLFLYALVNFLVPGGLFK